MTPRILRSHAFALALALAWVPACKPEEPPGIAIAAKVEIAPVAGAHPWVIACLTEASIQRPPGVDARLEGLTGAGGERRPDPVFEGETREALAEFLRAYEQDHPRPPELAPVWEPIQAADGQRWQLHFVDRSAGLTLDGEARAWLEPGSSKPPLRLRLGPAQREQLATLTRARLGERLAVTIDDEVVLLPIVHSEISGGELEVRTGPDDDPQALLARLQQPN